MPRSMQLYMTAYGRWTQTRPFQAPVQPLISVRVDPLTDGPNGKIKTEIRWIRYIESSWNDIIISR